MGRLFSPGAWVSLPFFQCPFGAEKCHWGRMKVKPEKSGADPAKVLSFNLDGAPTPYKLGAKLSKLCKQLFKSSTNCSTIVTKPYTKPLLYVKTSTGIRGSLGKAGHAYQLCLTAAHRGRSSSQLGSSLSRFTSKRLGDSIGFFGRNLAARIAAARVASARIAAARIAAARRRRAINKSAQIAAARIAAVRRKNRDKSQKNQSQERYMKDSNTQKGERSSKFETLVEKVKATHRYVLPADYTQQYLQVDLCDPKLLAQDGRGCGDQGMKKLGLKSTQGCQDKDVQHNCPSCSCKARRITAVATQGNPGGSSVQEREWVSEYTVSFLTSTDDGKDKWMFYNSRGGPTHLIENATILQGGEDNDAVQKNYFAQPLNAKAIRIHPMCWFGRSMAIRAEIFQCLHGFSWEALQQKLNPATTSANSVNQTATGVGEVLDKCLASTGNTSRELQNQIQHLQESSQAQLGEPRGVNLVSDAILSLKAAEKEIKKQQILLTKVQGTHQHGQSSEGDMFEDDSDVILGATQGRRGGRRITSKGRFKIVAGNRAGNSEDDEDEDDLDMGSTLPAAPAGGSNNSNNSNRSNSNSNSDSSNSNNNSNNNSSNSSSNSSSKHEEAGGHDAKPHCDDILSATYESFKKWTLGMAGSGAIYQTSKQKITVGSTEYTFQAYQRRVVKGAGLLEKRLVCFKTKTDQDESCCVGKDSELLGAIWPEQTIETKLL